MPVVCFIRTVFRGIHYLYIYETKPREKCCLVKEKRYLCNVRGEIPGVKKAFPAFILKSEIWKIWQEGGDKVTLILFVYVHGAAHAVPVSIIRQRGVIVSRSVSARLFQMPAFGWTGQVSRFSCALFNADFGDLQALKHL